MDNLRDGYAIVGGDYDDTVRRMGGEERVLRFIPKFIADPTFEELKESFAKEDWETAFRASHTIKGACANLGFTKLQKSSSELCEMLRPLEFNSEAPAKLEEVKTDYENIKNTFSYLL